YSVQVNAKGFSPQQQTGIVVTVGRSVTLNLTLGLGTVSQTVSVVDGSSVVNTSTDETEGLVNERQVKQLPLNGRSFDQLITLNPAAINYTNQRSGSVGTSNSSVGNMFSVSGRRPQDNLFLLNGIEYTGASLINNTPGGASGQLLGVDAVREFNVVTGTYGANYGQRDGAQVSIVTQSGTNQVHGTAYEFLRNSALDARNYFDQAQIPEFQRNNFGAALGGPLRRNRVFLFGNYEGYRQKLGLSDVTLVPDDASRAAADTSAQPLLALWPVANGPELGSGIAEAFSSPTQRVREDFGTTRLDATLTPKDSFFSVYTIDDSDANTPTANPLSLIYESLREQVLSAQEQHVVSSNLLNVFRIGYSRGAYYFTGQVPVNLPGWVTGEPIGAVVISGSTASNGSSQITGAGTNTGSNNTAVRNLFTVADHVYWSHGRHQVEAGGWLQRVQANDNLAQDQYGQASFSTLASFLKGDVATFTVVPAPTELGWRSLEGAGFAQDIWQATSRLKVRAGLRFESTNGWNEAQCRASNYGFTNGVINTDPTVGCSALTTNRAKFLPEPRAGLAWDVFGDGRTAVRAGFGIYRTLLDNLDYRLDETAPFNTSLTLKNVTVSGLSIAPGSTTASGSEVSPSNVQPDLYTPSVAAWSAKIEQQIAPATSLTIGYEGSHGYHQILSEDENEPASVVCPNAACPAALPAGAIYYPTTTDANPALANTTSWVSQGASNYNALEVDVRHQFTHGVQLRGVYTWSHNLDDGSAWNTSVSANTPAYVEYPANPHLDYGDAATDIRDLAAINGTWDLPFASRRRLIGGWNLSGIASLQAGFPFSPQLGYNPTGSGDSRNPVRPDVNPGFSGNLYPHTVSHWFNPNVFLAPASGTVGNLGRDTLSGPGLQELDLSVAKTTTIHESVHLQFRAEFFNIFNHSNFMTPNPVVYSSGPKPGSASAAPVLSPTAGVITASSTTSRQIQFGLKLLF
ncbi:MAG: carboxypeptidase-like regulatory domain-containing protein, partial [Acidobacteriaceae bacterium]